MMIVTGTSGVRLASSGPSSGIARILGDANRANEGTASIPAGRNTTRSTKVVNPRANKLMPTPVTIWFSPRVTVR